MSSNGTIPCQLELPLDTPTGVTSTATSGASVQTSQPTGLLNSENPKYVRAQKDGKPPLEYLVRSMHPLDAAVHKHGADKYGIRNWRKDPIRASTYIAAIQRHLDAWAAGEDLDPDSGLPHLSHVRACCAVALDAKMHDTLTDDRLIVESKNG